MIYKGKLIPTEIEGFRKCISEPKEDNGSLLWGFEYFVFIVFMEDERTWDLWRLC